MVLENLYRGLAGKRTIDPGSRVTAKNLIKQAYQYVVADTDYRAMPKRSRYVRSRRILRTKRRRLAGRRYRRRVPSNLLKVRVITDEVQIPAAGTGAYCQKLTNIQTGEGRDQRSEYSNKIRLQKYRFKADLNWNHTADATAMSVRFVLAYMVPGTMASPDTGITYGSNFYGRVALKNVTHVILDKTYTRTSTTTITTPIRLRANLKGRRIMYNPATSTDSAITADLVLFVVPGSEAAAGSVLINRQSKLTWTE